jgi:hypothetical protein
MKGKNAISTFELFELFPDQEAARIYLEGRACNCGLSERLSAIKQLIEP